MRCQAWIEAFSRPLTVLIGGFGSGKSELAILWARRLAEVGRLPVTLIDLDIFKPMFRSREAEQALSALGVRLAFGAAPSVAPGPPAELDGGNLGRSTAVIDVGGDAAGARVLRSIRPRLLGADFNLLFVVNTKRPRCADVDSATAELDAMESESGLRVTGLISNTHLLDDTDCDMVLTGLDLTRRIAARRGIAVVAMMIPEALVESLVAPGDVEVLHVHRMLSPPWMRDR